MNLSVAKIVSYFTDGGVFEHEFTVFYKSNEVASCITGATGYLRLVVNSALAWQRRVTDS